MSSPLFFQTKTAATMLSAIKRQARDLSRRAVSMKPSHGGHACPMGIEVRIGILQVSIACI
jgi:hypothetical protein